MARNRVTGVYRGEEGRRKADEQLKLQKERQKNRKEQGNVPFRFRVKDGNTTQFIVVDDEPDFYRFEHNLKNPQTGFWDIYTGCVAEYDNCPVCQASGREPYYALYLTVVDLTEFEDKSGVSHEFSRKLLVVKPAQQKKFIRAFAKAEQEGRTLRGAIFETTRDSDKDSAIGNDIELIDYMDEDELRTYVRSWKDREGKKHTEDCSEVLDYDKLFPEATKEDLRKQVGAGPSFGSREEEEENLRGKSRGRGRASRDDGDDDDDYEKPALRQRSKGRKEVEEDDDEETPRGRNRTRGRAVEDDEEEDKPARKSSRRGREVEEDEDEDEDTPKTRTSSRRGKEDDKPARTVRGGRDDPPFDPDEDDDDDDDVPVSRGRSSRQVAERPERKAPGTSKRVSVRGRR